jgi:MYXO-CTERM domain-containing protein
MSTLAATPTATTALNQLAKGRVTMRITKLAATAALIAVTPLVAVASASAQDADTETTAPAEDDDDFPWGLLGLAGLAGLLPRKRRDDDVRRTTTNTTDRR